VHVDVISCVRLNYSQQTFKNKVLQNTICPYTDQVLHWFRASHNIFRFCTRCGKIIFWIMGLCFQTLPELICSQVLRECNFYLWTPFFIKCLPPLWRLQPIICLSGLLWFCPALFRWDMNTSFIFFACKLISVILFIYVSRSLKLT
jgi:hypothetical protein